MKRQPAHEIRNARNQLRSLIAVGLFASCASAQLPTSPGLPAGIPSSTIDLQLPAPSLPGLPEPLPLAASKGLPALDFAPTCAQLPSASRRMVGILGLRSKSPAMAHKSQVPTNCVTAQQVPPPAVDLPTVSLPVALPTQMAMYTPPTLVQVQYEQPMPLDQLSDVPEIPEHIRKRGNTASSTAQPPSSTSMQNAVAHAYLAAEVPAEIVGEPQTEFIGTADLATPKDKPISDGPVVTGPVAEVALEPASLLDLNVDGARDLAKAVHGQVSSRSGTKGPARFKLKDSDDPVEQKIVAASQAKPKPTEATAKKTTDGSSRSKASESSPSDKPSKDTLASTKPASPSKLEVHESFATPKPVANDSVAANKKSSAQQFHLKDDDTTETSTPSNDKAGNEPSLLAGLRLPGDVVVGDLMSEAGESKISLASHPTLANDKVEYKLVDHSTKAASEGSPQSKQPSRVRLPLAIRLNDTSDTKSELPLPLTRQDAVVKAAPSPLSTNSVQVQPLQIKPIDNPIANSQPVVQAVKQAALPVNEPEAMVSPVALAQSTSAAATDASTHYRTLAMQMQELVRKKFPGSRIDLRSDEEGLIVQGTVSSEAEASKIVSFIRKTALCPVNDRVTTKY